MELPKFDLSKPPHPQVIDLFVPLIPGLFFEISVLAADRELRAAVGYLGLGPYSRSALFLFVAYFCGLSALVLNTLLLRAILQIFRSIYIFCYRRLREFETRVMH